MLSSLLFIYGVSNPRCQIWLFETPVPRIDCHLNSKCKYEQVWPLPQIVKSVKNKLRIPNLSHEPKILHKYEQFCNVRSVSTVSNSIPPNTCHRNKSILEDKYPHV